MPFTPFHLGPALLVGVLLYRWLDLPALLAGSVVVDVRAALVVFGPLDGPVHGVLTTFPGGLVLALAVAAGTLALPRRLQAFLDRVRLADTVAGPPVLLGAIVGVYSHVVLDSTLYLDARPFLPLEWNPFLLGGASTLAVYAACSLAGVLGGLAYAVRRHRTGASPRTDSTRTS